MTRRGDADERSTLPRDRADQAQAPPDTIGGLRSHRTLGCRLPDQARGSPGVSAVVRRKIAPYVSSGSRVSVWAVRSRTPTACVRM